MKQLSIKLDLLLEDDSPITAKQVMDLLKQMRDEKKIKSFVLETKEHEDVEGLVSARDEDEDEDEDE